MTTFFFDNDISFRIVNALKELVSPDEYELIALRDRFPVDAKDVDWIPKAGQNGWIVISRDHNQRRRDAEHRALRENGLRALYIRQSPSSTEIYSDAARIIRNWPKIRDSGNSAPAGTLVKLDTSDRIVPL